MSDLTYAAENFRNMTEEQKEQSKLAFCKAVDGWANGEAMQFRAATEAVAPGTQRKWSDMTIPAFYLGYEYRALTEVEKRNWMAAVRAGDDD